MCASCHADTHRVCAQTAAAESRRQVEQTGERLLTAESERDALVAALKEQQDSWATAGSKPEVRRRIHSRTNC
jgi:hypothetical protein